MRGSDVIVRTGLLLFLILAAITDCRRRKVYNTQVFAGIFAGILYFAAVGYGKGGNFLTAVLEVAGFLARLSAVCILFFPFFVCRMIGAGDIKLMGICVGALGIWDGIFAVFAGLLLAAAASAWKMYKDGSFRERLCFLGRFAARTGREHRLSVYREWNYRRDVIPLGPFLAAGYSIYLLFS